MIGGSILKRDITIYGHPALSKKAAQVKKIDKSICELVKDMAVVMEKEGGIGIAAPQVGESLQISIIDIPPNCGGLGRIVLINPKIISAYGSEIDAEGCLSAPGIQVKVKRFKEVTVEAMNLYGEVKQYKGTGLLARALQHEMDHLNGIVIIDKLPKLKKLMLKRKIKRKTN